GATVWPAAHVLAKYLERRFGNNGGRGERGTGGMEGLRAVDLGSGTGVAGIVAAALGAEVFLTDQEQLLFLMQENANRATRRVLTLRTPTTPTTARRGAIRVLTYDWGAEDERLSPPVDVVLVSDCVLPKLYPIEPLVDAIDRLSGPDTVTIMSYEHRHYQAFDPRTRFEELAAAKGLVKTVVPQARQHPIFSADDIEIWEVRRRQEQLAKDGHQEARGSPAWDEREGGTHAIPTSMEIAGTQDEVVIFSSSRPSETPSPLSEGEATATAVGTAAIGAVRTVVGILGEQHELAQTPSGALGCYLWPSAVVMARHLVSTAAAPSVPDSAGDGDPRRPMHRYPARARVLELRSGV
ncbi:unnamed protein product, partial [Hapterophycus canaliculatus]